MSEVDYKMHSARRVRLQVSIESGYIMLLAFLNVITSYFVSTLGFYGSAVLYKIVDRPEDALSNLLIILACLFSLHFLIVSQHPHSVSITPPQKKRIDLWYSIIIGINWLIFLTTGIGVAGTSTSGIGFLINILPIAPLMLVYFSARGGGATNWHYTINMALGISLTIAKGWSGIIIIMALIYIFERIKFINVSSFFRLSLLAILVVLSYKYLYDLKFYIRDGVNYDISYFTAAEYALSRVTAFQNFDYFSSIIPEFKQSIGGDPLFYLKEFFLALIPKSLIGYENFRPLDNIFATQFIAAGAADLDSSGFAITLPGIYRLAIDINSINWLLFPSFIFGLYWIIFRLCAKVWSPRVRYFFILSSLNLFYSGNMREYAFAIYALCIFLVLLKLTINKPGRPFPPPYC